jgi:hypothetical protein
MTSGCSILATEYAFWQNMNKGQQKVSHATHDLFWGKDTKLDFLHLADWSRRIGKLVAQHGRRRGNRRSKTTWGNKLSGERRMEAGRLKE